MLGHLFAWDRELGRHRVRWALGLGLAGGLCVGCPGAEPSASGAGGDGGAPPATSSSSTGKGGEAEGGQSSVSTGGGGEGGQGGCNAELATDVQNCGACGRACLHDDQVAEPRCIEGVCRPFCESGFVDMSTPEGPDDGCESVGRRVFVTSEATSGTALGGVSGADDRCQMLANQRKLGGKWSAWLSSGENSNSVAERFNREPEAPYMLLDGTVVAESWGALVDGSLDHAIDLTETAGPVAGLAINVWTGTTPAGLPTVSHCGAWANNANGEGTVGYFNATSAQWTQGTQAASCASQARLYCFEQ